MPMINTKQGINLENMFRLLQLWNVGQIGCNSKYESVECDKGITACINADKIAKTYLGMINNAWYYSVQNLLSSSLLSKTLKIKIYRTIVFPLVLYGCETWSLTLREERRQRVFENRELRRVFGPKRDEVTGNGENYIMRSLGIFTPYPILCGW